MVAPIPSATMPVLPNTSGSATAASVATSAATSLGIPSQLARGLSSIVQMEHVYSLGGIFKRQNKVNNDSLNRQIKFVRNFFEYHGSGGSQNRLAHCFDVILGEIQTKTKKGQVSCNQADVKEISCNGIDAILQETNAKLLGTFGFTLAPIELTFTINGFQENFLRGLHFATNRKQQWIHSIAETQFIVSDLIPTIADYAFDCSDIMGIKGLAENFKSVSIVNHLFSLLPTIPVVIAEVKSRLNVLQVTTPDQEVEIECRTRAFVERECIQYLFFGESKNENSLAVISDKSIPSADTPLVERVSLDIFAEVAVQQVLGLSET